jgi:hypothetical protein
MQALFMLTEFHAYIVYRLSVTYDARRNFFFINITYFFQKKNRQKLKHVDLSSSPSIVPPRSRLQNIATTTNTTRPHTLSTL